MQTAVQHAVKFAANKPLLHHTLPKTVPATNLFVQVLQSSVWSDPALGRSMWAQKEQIAYSFDLPTSVRVM